MRVRTRGDGPPLVLIHGWAMHCGLFGPLLDRLADHHCLYLIDLPGHGVNRDDPSPLQLASCVESIASSTPPAAWLGWSLGGLFALHAASHRPAHVPALIMLCSTPCFARASNWPHGMQPDLLRRFDTDLGTDLHGTIERFLALETLGCKNATTELRRLRAEAFVHGDPSPQALAEGLQLLEHADLRDDLRSLIVPSLWIGARRDRLVDPRAVTAAAAMAPGSRTLQLDSGHAPFLTHADALAAAVTAFLQEPARHDSSQACTTRNLPIDA